MYSPAAGMLRQAGSRGTLGGPPGGCGESERGVVLILLSGCNILVPYSGASDRGRPRDRDRPGEVGREHDGVRSDGTGSDRDRDRPDGRLDRTLVEDSRVVADLRDAPQDKALPKDSPPADKPTPADQAPGADGCPPGWAVCAGVCVNISISPTHCGGCWVNCKFGTCCDGECFMPPNTPPC